MTTPFLVGGPGTRLPFVVESFLGWSLCISCLTVSGYHYVKSVILSSRRIRCLVRSVLGGWLITNSTSGNDAELDDWIPLTTYTRAEIERCTPWQRYLSLVQVLELRYPDALLPSEQSQSGSKANNDAGEEVATTNDRQQASNITDIEMVKRKADDELIRALRQDDVCRRLASLAMRPYKLCDSASVDTETTILEQHPHNRLLQRISKMWKYLLILPSLKEAKSYRHSPSNDAAGIDATTRIKRRKNDGEHYPYQISIIMPAFHEKGSHLIAKLSRALETCTDPEEIEVVIVDAGGCTDLDKVASLSLNEMQFGKITIISFTAEGGRGPCLNFGAQLATGRILTFCHSDTTLPNHWDKSIVSTLEPDGIDDDDLFRLGKIRSNSCAFAFGIDTSPAGLAMPFAASSQSASSPTSRSYFPPGIRAVEATANLRTHLYSLPYGDQVLTLHACVFHFLGGFPDQCLMEDYELVSLLRRRAALLDGVYPNGQMKLKRMSYEKVAIIPGPSALCSPRRWQKFGVMYTTFTNSRLVSLYAGARNMSADELFQLYYGKEPPMRSSEYSPWELELKQLLGDGDEAKEDDENEGMM